MKEEYDPVKSRLEMGEAWVYCEDCMGKINSFDGYRDKLTPCPYKDRSGKCKYDKK